MHALIQSLFYGPVCPAMNSFELIGVGVLISAIMVWFWHSIKNLDE